MESELPRAAILLSLTHRIQTCQPIAWWALLSDIAVSDSLFVATYGKAVVINPGFVIVETPDQDPQLQRGVVSGGVGEAQVDLPASLHQESEPTLLGRQPHVVVFVLVRGSQQVEIFCKGILMA